MYSIDSAPVLTPESEETLVMDNAETNETSPEVDNGEEIESSPKKTGDELWKQRQSDIDKQKAEIARKEAEVLRKEQEINAKLNPPKPEIVKPVKPVMPEGYNKFDAINDLDSPSAAYDEAERQYLIANDEYRDSLTSQLIQEREQEKQAANQKAEMEKERQYHLGELVMAGCDPQKATQVLNFMASKESLDYKNVIAYYDMVKGQPKISRQNNPNIPPAPASTINGGERVYDESDSYTLQEEERKKKFIL